jgi:peptidoglycan/LPS O-acetylase OafA/YrhL
MNYPQKIVSIVLVVIGLLVGLSFFVRNVGPGDTDPAAVMSVVARVTLLMFGGWVLFLAALRAVSNSDQHEMILVGSVCILGAAAIFYSTWAAPISLALLVGASMFSRDKQS